MPAIWDYDIEELKKTEWGRRLILERQVDYGVRRDSNEKINLAEVKKNWDKIEIQPSRRRLLKLLIWGN